ncbi:class I SAM-dependent methyltransferase [Candidatus Marinamargulisbacteria bacterium]|nr:class I SAM-dependent methyltransferase [Candidatus Marinamargulisbacteria bacterium]
MDKLYEIDNNGLVRQKEYQIIQYKEEYLDVRYRSYGQNTVYMSYLRLGFLLGVVKENISSILDFGCGTGDFLKVASLKIPNTYSYDIIDHNYKFAKKIEKVEDIYKMQLDVVTFFDSLEHVTDPYEIIRNINTEYIFISVPWCHLKTKGEKWFMNWKHRRYNEHLWHFDLESLSKFFKSFGYDLIKFSNFEDIISQNSLDYQNILSCIFQKNR